MSVLYDTKPGEVYWAASDVGWVVGHSYIVYGPLLQGCTTVLYEGKPVGTPDAGAFWRVIISEHKVSAMFTAPTAFRAIKREDPEGKLLKRVRPLAFPHAVPRRRALRSRHATMWAQKMLGVPVVDHWWQTETGSRDLRGNPIGVSILAGQAGLRRRSRCRAGTCRCSDADGHPVPAGQIGAICCKLPLPPGTLPTLWNAEERFFRAISRSIPAGTRPAMPGWSMPRATSTS